jgi:hypothetical protein
MEFLSISDVMPELSLANRTSMPGSIVLPWIFVLFKRIFFDLSLEFIVTDAPSAMFTGGGDGARSWRSQINGEEGQGLDSIFALYFRVFVAISQPHVVIPCCFKGLSINLYRLLD